MASSIGLSLVCKINRLHLTVSIVVCEPNATYCQSKVRFFAMSVK